MKLYSRTVSWIRDYRAPWLEAVGWVWEWIDRHTLEFALGTLLGIVVVGILAVLLDSAPVEDLLGAIVVAVIIALVAWVHGSVQKR